MNVLNRLLLTMHLPVNWFIAALMLVLFAKPGHLQAQTIQAAGQAYMVIHDTSILATGATYNNNMTVQFNGGNASLPEWKLTVQPLTAYFTALQISAGDIAQWGYGPNWPLQYFSLQFNPGSSQNSWSDANSVSKIGVPSNVIPLTATEITLVERSNHPIIAHDYFSLSYNLILHGNRQMMALHRDDYALVMRYRLYNKQGVLLNQSDYSHKIGLWPPWTHLPQTVTPAILNGIVLQNGANNVTLNFNAPTAFANGVETSINNGLQVSSSDGKYQITVQTLSEYFSKSGSSSVIPVNKVRLTATPVTSSVLSTYNAVDLSASPKNFIRNAGTAPIVNNYNIKYSTKHNTNQDAFMSVEAGNYETQITFIMSPL
jgi:hypothetical protein